MFLSPFIYRLLIILFFQPFPFCLTQSQVVGTEGISVSGFSGGVLLFCQQGNTHGTLVQPVFRRQDQIGNFSGKGFMGQHSTVAHQENGAVDVFQFCFQFRKGDGPVLRKSGEFSTVCQEQGIVDLLLASMQAQTWPS